MRQHWDQTDKLRGFVLRFVKPLMQREVSPGRPWQLGRTFGSERKQKTSSSHGRSWDPNCEVFQVSEGQKMCGS